MSSTRFSLALLMTGALLAGCAAANSPSDSSEGEEMASGSCDAAPVQRLVGQPATPELLEQARNQAGAKLARILKPGDIITMEFNDQRLNLEVDDAGVITRVYCG